jgi:formamidopyrimidine-DNA glycosylase
VPELPEVEATRRRIAPSLVRTRIDAAEIRRPDLRAPFPRDFARRLTGHTVDALTRRAKYLLASLSSGETLLVHLGMSGSFRVVSDTAAAAEPHDHVVLHLSSGRLVVFNDPRRFGLMDLAATKRLDDHPALAGLGPEPLSPAFTPAALARACHRRKTSLKAALLDQGIVAGLGNIYASEALHAARLSPRRPASILATPSGAPREAAVRLSAAIKRVLRDAIERQVRRGYRDRPFVVYERQGEPCLRKHCPGRIRRLTQTGRSTYYCPVCQR